MEKYTRQLTQKKQQGWGDRNDIPLWRTVHELCDFGSMEMVLSNGSGFGHGCASAHDGKYGRGQKVSAGSRSCRGPKSSEYGR